MSNGIWEELKNKQIQVQMPDKTRWQINCLDLCQRMIRQNLSKEYPDDSYDGTSFVFLEEYLKDGDNALQRWANLLEWNEVKDIAEEILIHEQDHTLGWRLGRKEVHNKN